MCAADSVAQLALGRFGSYNDGSDLTAKRYLLDVWPLIHRAPAGTLCLVFPQRQGGQVAVTSLDRPKLSRFRVADVNMADVTGVITHLELSEPVTFG